jgi:glycosyltransferase involved in cell wall biosynthesis
VVRVRLGADIAATVPSTGTCDGVTRILEHLRFRPAILAVGTVEPRKGYEATLAAFDRLWRNRPDAPDLIIVGKPGWKTEELQAAIRSHPEFGRRLHWFDRMSDEGLCLLYEACRGVLVASRGEGWGLPLVEAAMHRRYVLARDLRVFREHDLPNVLYFNDDSPEALAEKLSELAVIAQNAAPAANLPTWSDCVESILHKLGLIDMKELHAEPLRIAS